MLELLLQELRTALTTIQEIVPARAIAKKGRKSDRHVNRLA
ncbi:hypothetical protein [Burkholderia sp. PU8-34]